MAQTVLNYFRFCYLVVFSISIFLTRAKCLGKNVFGTTFCFFFIWGHISALNLKNINRKKNYISCLFKKIFSNKIKTVKSLEIKVLRILFILNILLITKSYSWKKKSPITPKLFRTLSLALFSVCLEQKVQWEKIKYLISN